MPYEIIRLPDGGVSIQELGKCSKCGQYVPWQEEADDLDTPGAWPDGDTYVCRQCR